MPRERRPLHYLIPIAIVTLSVCVLWNAYNNPTTPAHFSEEKQPVPSFSLPTLAAGGVLTEKIFQGQVTLLNIWATWCAACQEELPLLLTIQQTYHVPLVGLNYKDSYASVQKWLKPGLNPYTVIGMDYDGRVGASFGVLGLPETFLVDKHGIIRYRYAGTLHEHTWKETLWPLVKQYQAEI